MRIRVALMSLTLALAATVPACSEEEISPAANDGVRGALLQDEIERLQALGYAGASQEAESAANVTLHNRTHAGEGYNFYVSGHAPEAILMDMAGRTLHRWRHDFEVLERRRGRAEPTPANSLAAAERRHWRRAYLYPNGDVLAIHSQYALIRIDRNSKLLWEYPKRVHHDLEVLPDAKIYVLAAESRLLPRINPNEDVLEDFVVVLDPDGKELRKVSLLESVENAGLQDLLKIMPYEGDLFHTNSLRVLDGRFADRIPAFRKGNVLVSFLTLNTVAVVDLEAEKVVWTLQGDFRFQHDPKLLDDGSLLLFDNLGPAMRGTPLKRRRGWPRNLWYHYIFSNDEPANPASAVLEIDPLTGRIEWSYEGTPDAPFSSETLGAAHRLPNRSTLIVESEAGRVFEVTPEGEIVWQFVSPHRVGGLVARLFDVVRLPPEFPIDWAEAGAETSYTRGDAVP